MTALVLKSIAHPTHRYTVSAGWPDYTRAGNYFDCRLQWFDTMGDGETQHTPAAPVLATAENLQDFAAAAARWFTGSPTEEEKQAYFDVFHYLPVRISPRIIDALAELKYNPDRPQWFTTEDTKDGTPRKSTNQDKRHDKRWTEVTEYNAGGTAEKVYRALYDVGEIGEHWDALRRWSAYRNLREYMTDRNAPFGQPLPELFRIEDDRQTEYALKTLEFIAEAINARERVKTAATGLQPIQAETAAA